MKDTGPCPLCDYVTAGRLSLPATDNTSFRCHRCGDFEVNGSVLRAEMLTTAPEIERRRYLLRAWTRTSRTRRLIDVETIKRLEQGFPPDKTVAEKIELMMRWFADQSTEIGQLIAYSKDNDYPTAWCRSPAEWQTIFAHLVNDLRHLELNNDPLRLRCKVTIEGLDWLGARPSGTGNKGFIAMWFDKSLDGLKIAIENGISEAGYSPLRIDEDHFTGGVMDRIVASIKESRFVVADFTGNRGGVYYEAGFAAGLGIPVFCLCEEGQTDRKHKDPIHFDVAHLRMIPWKSANLDEVTAKLRDAILATVGRSPAA